MNNNIAPETTVIMTSYNYSQYIKEAIDSVISQTYTDWELIVVDDGSQDNSLHIINDYTSKYPQKIKFFTHLNNENKGIKDTNELAFSKVRSKYVAFLESDDIWMPECLEKKINSLKGNPEAVLAFSDLQLLEEDDFESKRYKNYLKYCRYVGKKCKENPASLQKMILFRNPVISFSNIVIKSEILKGFEILKEHEIWSDWQLVIHSAIKGKFIYAAQKLLYWRLHKKSQYFNYMNNTVDKKNHDFKLKMSDKMAESNMLNNLSIQSEYPFPIKTIIYKLFHDLGFALKHPDAAFFEIRNMLEK